jgi:hypothetical protein
VANYLDQLAQALDKVPADERTRLVEQAKAQIELELELEGSLGSSEEAIQAVLSRMGAPETLADRVRSATPAPPAAPAAGRLTACRACRQQVSREARACPHCGAPFPARQGWNGPGFDWKSARTLFGYPLVHVAFGRDAEGKMRVARGIVAIGQFGIGAVTIAQFGVGAVLGLGQFVVAPLAIAQFAFGLAAIGQIGIGLLFGLGQVATGAVAIGQLTLGNWLRGG